MPETTLNIRIDSELKEKSQDLFRRMGLDVSTAVNIFLRQAVHDQALPFRPSVENPDNVEARQKRSDEVQT